jgi:fatty acid desaturase
MTSRLYFQPVWDFAYKYKGKQYNAIMDGRVGTVTGGRPVSRWKVTILVIIIVVVLIIIALLVCGFCGGGSICAGMGGYALNALDNVLPYIA